MGRGIISKYGNLARRRVITTRALGVVGVLLTAVILLTYYGMRVGNFVITVSGRYITGLALTVDENKIDERARLVADPLADALDADYSFIPNDIEEGLGSKNDKEEKRYFAYSFYLLNTGNVSVSYTLNYDLLRVSNGLDSIMRIMIIKDGERTVYAKHSEQAETYGQPEPVRVASGYLFDTVPFIIDQSNTIIKQSYYDLQVGGSTKFTIVMWLDGWDNEQTQSMMGGQFQTKVTFKVLYENQQMNTN